MQTQELLDRYEYTTKLQRTEIARLRAVVERQEEELTQLLAWINGDSDSLTILQRIAQDPVLQHALMPSASFERGHAGEGDRCWRIAHLVVMALSCLRCA